MVALRNPLLQILNTDATFNQSPSYDELLLSMTSDEECRFIAMGFLGLVPRGDEAKAGLVSKIFGNFPRIGLTGSIHWNRDTHNNFTAEVDSGNVSVWNSNYELIHDNGGVVKAIQEFTKACTVTWKGDIRAGTNTKTIAKNMINAKILTPEDADEMMDNIDILLAPPQASGGLIGAFCTMITTAVATTAAHTVAATAAPTVAATAAPTVTASAAPIVVLSTPPTAGTPLITPAVGGKRKIDNISTTAPDASRQLDFGKKKARVGTGSLMKLAAVNVAKKTIGAAGGALGFVAWGVKAAGSSALSLTRKGAGTVLGMGEEFCRWGGAKLADPQDLIVAETPAPQPPTTAPQQPPAPTPP